jgi:hypothetical protein
MGLGFAPHVCHWLSQGQKGRHGTRAPDRAWRLNVKQHLARLALSLFLLVHLAALLLWNMPACALQKQASGWVAHYLMPTGQWQQWGMFAPEPLRETLALEVAGRDAQGVVHTYKFPHMAGKPVEVAFLGYRHSKFSHNMIPETAVAYREFAARHAVRSWNLPPEAFPVELDLYYQMRRPAQIGEPPADPNAPPEIRFLQAYRFPTREEVEP